MLWSEVCSHLVFQGVNLEKLEERRLLKCSIIQLLPIQDIYKAADMKNK